MTRVVDRNGQPSTTEGFMSWITWVALLVAWPLIGLGVAYLFGRFTHAVEASGRAGELAPQLLSYLHPARRVKNPTRATTQSKGRRDAAGGRRAH